MTAISIDGGRCTACGKCVEECPAGVLALNGRAEIINPRFCISCGHCAAICPEDAVACAEGNTSKPFTVRAIDPAMPADRALFHKKRSVRTFMDKPIPKETVNTMIEYAEKAPSSHNFRNRKYIVIAKPEDITEISHRLTRLYKKLLAVLNPVTLAFVSLFNKKAGKELAELAASFKHMVEESEKGGDKIFKNSKLLICIAAPSKSTQSKDDCVAAQHYMMLYGKTIDVDSYIVGYAQYGHKILETYCGLAKGYSIFAVSAFGCGRHTYGKEVVYAPPEIIRK